MNCRNQAKVNTAQATLDSDEIKIAKDDITRWQNEKAACDTLHAVTMTTSQGTELLIHIGLDTVTLKGEPFISHVSGGQQVKKGDLLLEADLEKIKSAGLDTITPVLICNTDDYNKINLIKEGEVSIDDEVLKIS